jgi:hypothetical protein
LSDPLNVLQWNGSNGDIRTWLLARRGDVLRCRQPPAERKPTTTSKPTRPMSDAHRQAVQDNLNLVRGIAWDHARKHKIRGESIDELLAVANSVLCDLVLTFDPNRGATLETYIRKFLPKRLATEWKRERRHAHEPYPDESPDEPHPDESRGDAQHKGLLARDDIYCPADLVPHFTNCLSSQERDAIKLLCAGQSNTEIERVLHVGERRRRYIVAELAKTIDRLCAEHGLSRRDLCAAIERSEADAKRRAEILLGA